MSEKTSVFDEHLYYKEGEQFVVIGDEIFCDNDCNTCPYKDKCQNEEAEVFTDMVIPARYVICTSDDRGSYTDEPTKDTRFNEDGGRYEGNYLPASGKRVYKVVEKIDGIDFEEKLPTHIVFCNDKYYCLKQRCSVCKYKEDCTRTLEIKDSYKDVLVAIDARAQEPRSFLLTTKLTGNYEREWDKVFYNDTIRELGAEYRTLITVFRNIGVDTDTDIFKLWCNRQFFFNKTDLYKLSEYMNHYIVEQSIENKKQLKTHIEKLYNSYKELENGN